MFKKILFIFIIIESLLSQRVLADVTVNAPRLTETQKSDIINLEREVEDYINNFRWIDNSYEDEIACNINILIESVNESGSINKYSAQFVITSTAKENFYDKQFEFIYGNGEPLNRFGSGTRPIANFIDFYIYMVVAGELDTYTLYGGDEYYNKAREALTIGVNSSQLGWDVREKLHKSYTSPLILPARKAKLLIYSALNSKKSKDFIKMRETAKQIVIELEYATKGDPSNTLLKRFFEAYYKNLISTLDPVQDQIEIKKLIQIDPVRRDYYFEFVE